MNAAKTAVLAVPGASLYYTVRGSGPLLLILQGGAGNAEASEAIANDLASFFTIVTYDRRGLSRSKLETVPETLDLETHAADAHRLLAELTTVPALLFGSSIGAVIGLDLAARHPEQVSLLVAHEPPAFELLPEPERAEAEKNHHEVQQLFRQQGVPAAMKRMAASAGVDFNDREPELQLPQTTAGGSQQVSEQRAADLTFFLTYDAPAVRRHRLDLARLKSLGSRILPAGGQNSGNAHPNQCVRRLAAELGVELVEFPGGHTGHVLRPKAFAQRLRQVLETAQAAGIVRTSRPRRPEDFDALYDGAPPWDIGRPQPALLALADAGAFTGRALDVGCGTGEHVLMLAARGLDATGVDSSPTAIAHAESKARDRGLKARFVVGNALELASLGGLFDTVLDSGLFHVFDDQDRRAFVESLGSVVSRGGRYFLLCFSEHQPGDWGPRRVTQNEIRASFEQGWRIDSIEAARFDTRIGADSIRGWLARLTRT